MPAMFGVHVQVDAFGREKAVRFEDLAAFPYAEAVFSEAMRMYPPVTPMIALVSVYRPKPYTRNPPVTPMIALVS